MLYTDTLIVSQGFFHKRVPRRATVEAVLPIRLSISLSTYNLLLVVDAKYMNSSTIFNW